MEVKISKNFLLISSLLVSIIGLFIIYFASVNVTPPKLSVSDITADLEGRKVSVIGYVVEKSDSKAGHVFLTISDNKTSIEVPLFAQLMKNLQKEGITSKSFHIHDRMSVTGTVDMYKGNLQVIPSKQSDVVIMGK